MSDDLPSETFPELMQQLRAGSQDAARRIFEQYGEFIYRAVRRRLNRELRSKFDSQDFVQSVWASFFLNIDQVRTFNDPDDFIRYLARMAANKVIDESRRRFGVGRNVNRELRLVDPVNDDKPIYISNAPTPSEELIAKEQWQTLTDDQTPREKAVFEMRAEQSTFAEIARRLKISPSTARRIVERRLRRSSNG
ncbi:MAG TPA: sigma-70 family RNA polymerase sigma factor [Planctomycetaceae bacterium]|nr:sigma-70 family RNA polymerase sigma factor [Planctomycetaceae bacterium]